MRGAFSIALVAAAISSAATAAEWKTFSRTTHGSSYDIDVASIKLNGGFASAWVRGDYSRDASVNYRSTKELWRFNCQEVTSMTASFIAYKADGTVLRSWNDAFNQYQPVAPDTIGETALQIACRAGV